VAVVAVGSRQPESKIDPMTTLALTTSMADELGVARANLARLDTQRDAGAFA